MVKAVKQRDDKGIKKKGNRRSRPFALCTEDQVLLTLMYYRVSPMKYFAVMADHRHPSYITHPLPTIIGITIAAVICGAGD